LDRYIYIHIYINRARESFLAVLHLRIFQIPLLQSTLSVTTYQECPPISRYIQHHIPFCHPHFQLQPTNTALQSPFISSTKSHFCHPHFQLQPTNSALESPTKSNTLSLSAIHTFSYNLPILPSNLPLHPAPNPPSAIHIFSYNLPIVHPKLLLHPATIAKRTSLQNYLQQQPYTELKGLFCVHYGSVSRALK
jgi:hypothetical protein